MTHPTYLPFKEGHLPEFSYGMFYVILSLFVKEDQVLTICTFLLVVIYQNCICMTQAQ